MADAADSKSAFFGSVGSSPTLATMDKLAADVIEAALAALPTWRREGDAIVRTHRASSDVAALELVARIGALAVAAGHHPELTWVYDRLELSLSTHDAGGLTQKDFDLATQIEGALAA